MSSIDAYVVGLHFAFKGFGLVLTALFACKYYCRANDENDDTKVKMQQAMKNCVFF